jgi:Tat protein secretion system quality control protein TatD with DNase activity
MTGTPTRTFTGSLSPIRAKGLKIMMHCYSAGTRLSSIRFMDLGCLFSIAGPVTFKNGQDHRDAVAKIPFDRLGG